MSSLPTVLVKIDSETSELLMDHRVITREDADKLSTLFKENPRFVVSLSGSVDWEEYLHNFTIEIIDDPEIIDAFRVVYPEGIHTLPIYDDIWETIDSEASGE